MSTDSAELSSTTSDSTGEIVVELDDVHRHYVMGDSVVRALNGVDLKVRRGEFWAIIGASGSGKSTMLNVLGALDRPTAGSYRIGVDDVATLSDDELSEVRGRSLGFVFQSFHLIAQLTIVENVEVPLFYQGVHPQESRERAQRMLHRVGLGDRLDHRPQELSGGQQQRVAVARALVNDPLVLLADEPTGNLDTKTTEEILALFDELHQQGSTLIMVTHDPEVAERATWVLRMSDGQVAEVRRGRGVTHSVAGGGE